MFCFNSLFAQDSSRSLSPDQFFAWVVEFHPVSRQAKLISTNALANLKSARGNFDPYLFSDASQKFFSGANYYLVTESGLKIPTWYGLEIKAAYDYNNGTQLNPEKMVPEDGQANVSVAANLGAGLLMNERMAAVKRAKIFVQSSEAERRILLNNLLRDAGYAYWDWVAAWRKKEVYKEALLLSEFRYRGMVNSFLQGDVPAIDTLEAYIQVQTRQTQLIEANLKFKNEGLKLNTFLWWENNLPLELQEETSPADFMSRNTVDADSIERRMSLLAEDHPELLSYRFKIAELDVERKLKSEKLRPVLNVEYGLLAPQFSYGNSGLIGDNYKWGINFRYPLFLRNARGDLAMTKIKMESVKYEQQLKTLQLINKITAQQNILKALNVQIDIYVQAVSNYEKLLQAETIRFENGESSVFLINRREVYLVDALLRLVDYETDYQKSMAELAFSMGAVR